MMFPVYSVLYKLSFESEQFPGEISCKFKNYQHFTSLTVFVLLVWSVPLFGSQCAPYVNMFNSIYILNHKCK